MRKLTLIETTHIYGGTVADKIIIGGLCSFVAWGVIYLQPKAAPYVGAVVGTISGIYGATWVFSVEDLFETALYFPPAYAGGVVGYTLGCLWSC